MPRLYYKFAILVTLFVVLVSTEEDDHDHHDHSSGDIFEEIFEHLNTTLKDSEGHSLLSVGDFEKLHEDLNFRTCGANEESNSCNLVS
jgi:hypothetical protein